MKKRKPNTLADWPFPAKLQCFRNGGNDELHTVSIGSHKKFKFQCDQCPHVFESRLCDVTRANHPSWCPYCAGRSLCRQEECKHCWDRSLASWPFPAKLQCFRKGGNDEPHTVSISSNKKFKFQCDQCSHVFKSVLSSVTNPKHPSWCPYCAGQKLCRQEECKHCWDRSLASWPFPAKLECFRNGGNDEPHTVSISSGKKFKFQCDQCPHVFESALNNVTNSKQPRWCPYCAGRICGASDCTICTPCCSVCRVVEQICKGHFPGNMCREHYLISGHAPPNTRAKVSLEIYMFAEIQRLSENTPHQYIWCDPTSWDCAILPGLAYKPDNIWVFDKHCNIFATAGACKINKDLVGHVIVVEILEVGIEQHSAARAVPDALREREIRQVFAPQPVDFLYVVVAAYNHPTAHRDDQFFRKPVDSFEYKLVPSRQKAWGQRIKETLLALERLYTERQGTTVFIGH